MLDIILLTFLIVLLTLSSGFFSASETALFSLSSMKIKAYENDANPRKRLIAKLVLSPQDLFVTLFILNISVNILIQNSSASLFSHYSSWWFSVGVPLSITVLLGEIIPKYIAIQNNAQVAYIVSPIVAFFTFILKPFRYFIIKLTIPISKMMFFFLKKEKEISKEELQHVLESSKEYGVLHADEAELIDGYLNLINNHAKELMRPRADVLFYDKNDPLSKLTYLFVDQKCSRLPVCDHDLDNVLGIINGFDFFLYRSEIQTADDLKPILTSPFYIPESTPARTLLKEFDQKNESLALVVDEYGSVSGLITHEDLAEVVVGEISDRRDQEVLFTRDGNEAIIASGKLELSEFKEIFDTELVSTSNMLTLGGWLLEQLEDIPKSGTKFETPDFLFQVLAADPNRIKRVYVRKKHNRREHK